MTESLTLTAIPDIPLIAPGDDLGAILVACLRDAGIAPQKNDILVIAQKIVSKAEGRYVDLAQLSPGPEARRLSEATGKDPRLVEAVLAESTAILRHRTNVLVVEHRCGYVMANAGIDQSNIDPSLGVEPALLLPLDSDASASRLKSAIDAAFGQDVGVIVNDSFGRAWRQGVVGVALGSAGIPALIDMRGAADLSGRTLRVTEIAFADEIAAAASLIMGQGNQARPAVLVRGLSWEAPDLPATALIRPRDQDLFR